MATASDAQDYASLEKLYQSNPEAYRRRVAGFIALGYGYVALSII